MSKQQLENFKAQLAANRAAKLERKLRELYAEMEKEKALDEFLILAQTSPAPRSAAIG
jgi:hypothetical protein